MFKKALLTIMFVTMFNTVAWAQFVDNGGSAGSADTSAFGQADSFANATTIFDGIEFRLQRLIRDPSDATKLRMVGQLENVGDTDKWVLHFLPKPTFTDELGNVYHADLVSGVGYCEYSNDWMTNLSACDNSPNPRNASRLAPGVPVITSVRFVAGTGQSGFSEDLAGLATSGTVQLTFVLSPDAFDNDDSFVLHQVVVPTIPIPR